MTSWNGGSVLTSSISVPLEFPPHTPSEVMGAAGLKKRSRERVIMLAGNVVEPTPMSSITTPAAAAPCAPTPSNNNPSTTSTARHGLSHRQLVLLCEMLNNANATVNVAIEDLVVEAKAMISPSALNVNREWRWGNASSSTATLPSEDNAQQQGGKRRSGGMGYRIC